ncbi:hypothetical protein ABMA28_008396 [Loxostege sticticalis]|uniref:Serpin domain-containing protein n=1 Tax=Loxostege sticticalis TaxID=481309 RepID=A0ABD0SHR2_LOXSC
MALFTFLVACSTALAAESQYADYRLGMLNPDLIYFNEGGQRYPLNVLPVATRRQQEVSDLKNENNVPGANKLPLPVNMIPDGPVGPPPVANVNPLQRPSAELTPPDYKPIPTNNDLQKQTELVNRFAEDSDTKAPDVQQNSSTTVDNVSIGVSQFGINIMKTLLFQQGNVVVSPFSIATLLALLQQGSLGATQRQISNALQMSPSDAADGFKRLADNLQKRSSTNIFKVGNGVFLDEGFNVNPAFKRIAMKDFNSEVNQIKFSRPQQAAQKINNWIAAITNNKINQLLTPDSLGVNTQLALVNAVYFKGIWQVKFRPDSTMPKDFYMYNGGKKTANFMRMRRYFKTDFDPSIGSQVLILPFEGEHYSLMVILPSESTNVMSAAAALTPEKLLSYQNYTPKEVALEIPKFTVKSDTNLVTVFQQLGIINIFGPQSELSGLGNYREFAPQVSSALHSALLSIDEQGGTAAAATSFGVVALSYDDPSVIFRANRPFLAVLWDRQTSLPLFMAKIEDPVS